MPITLYTNAQNRFCRIVRIVLFASANASAFQSGISAIATEVIVPHFNGAASDFYARFAAPEVSDDDHVDDDHVDHHHHRGHHHGGADHDGRGHQLRRNARHQQDLKRRKPTRQRRAWHRQRHGGGRRIQAASGAPAGNATWKAAPRPGEPTGLRPASRN